MCGRRRMGGRLESGRAGAPPRWLVGVVVFLACCCFVGAQGTEKPQTNVIFILVDDLGFHDISLHGSTDVDTPNIDRLARDGAMFWNAYSNAGFCSPARAGMMTGRHPQKFGYVGNPPHTMEDRIAGLPPNMTIMSNTFKAAGYNTKMIGKWHMGFHAMLHPLKRGFDEFFGFLGGHFTYRMPYLYVKKWRHLEYIYDGFKVPRQVAYLTVEFTTQAIEFVRKSLRQEKPFFIYLSLNAPHAPFEPKWSDMDDSVDEDRRAYVSLIKTMDDQIGRLMEFLDKQELLPKTMIVFTNDNGGHLHGADNFPFRGFKGVWYEGGVRVPFFLYWKGHIARHQNITDPITLLDIYPTLQAAANIPPEHRNPDLEGTNLLPYVRKPDEDFPERQYAPHTHICMSTSDSGMVRKTRWKAHFVRDRLTELYDLDTDIAEEFNVRSKKKNIVRDLTYLYKGCNAQEVPKLFNRYLQPTPIKLTMLPPPNAAEGSRNPIKVGDEVPFGVWSLHEKDRILEHKWEFYRPRWDHLANFRDIRSNYVRYTMNITKKRVLAVFRRPGNWVVRVTARDGRFSKWATTAVFVH